MGTLRLMAAASAPSARIHGAPGSTPASSSSRRRGTPVHSLHETRPCVWPAVRLGGVGWERNWLLPEHSKKWVRGTIGDGQSAAALEVSGRFALPRSIQASVFGA